MQGKLEASLKLTSGITGVNRIMSDYQINGERVEIYSAQGQNLDHPVQILEPVQLALDYTTKLTGDNEVEEVNVKFEILSQIDITLSMQNAALADTIFTSMRDSFNKGQANSAKKSEVHALSDEEISRVLRLASALEKNEELENDNVESKHISESEHSFHQPKDTEQGTTNKVSQRVHARATFPDVVFRVINDLQGHD
eukprot:8753567-Ditylum_brightwellii.AAC.1